jgi:SnoaL-like domain
VVQDHLDAVRTLDARAMSADYADDAVLERPDRIWRGRREIEAYFRTVQDRLAGGRVEFLGIDPQPLEVRWRIVGGPGDGIRGRDSYQIVAGRIAAQRVRLDDHADF